MAIVTAVTTNRRQERELATEAERQRLTLEAESGRLQQQLLHDRELADVAAVRSALDAAALSLQRVGVLPPGFFLTNGDEAHVRELLNLEIVPATTRLVVRFGLQHAVVDEFRACEEALWSWTTRARLMLSAREDGPNEDGPDDDEHSHAQALSEHADKFEDSTKRFLEAAAKAAGARLS